MNNLWSYLIFVVVIAIPMLLYKRSIKRKDVLAQESAEKGKLYSDGPKAQHPHIDTAKCIGCGSCVDVCPEGDVLAVFAGKAAIINGHKCIGHSLCADVCPVGAIEMVMASPSMGADLPYLTPEYETNLQNMYIIGELGGLALIKNAVNQGSECIDVITKRLAANAGSGSTPGVFDVCIVGAGPGGISASLRAIENKLNYLTIEQDELGGTVAKYPRQKLVMTSPVKFPTYGTFRKMEISKEGLLEFWDKVSKRADFRVNTNEKVESIKKQEDGSFSIVTVKGQYSARAVVLALGRRGTPRKLGIKGEELPKVMYSLIEADAYINKRILVVGGGDSAIEAAMGLAHQPGNEVTLSYRKDRFTRIKERNAARIRECMKTGKVNVLFNSNPTEVKEGSVILEVNGALKEISNDYVWVFAGGTPPNAFLEKIGVEFGTRDMTLEAGKESKLATLEGKQLVEVG